MDPLQEQLEALLKTHKKLLGYQTDRAAAKACQSVVDRLLSIQIELARISLDKNRPAYVAAVTAMQEANSSAVATLADMSELARGLELAGRAAGALEALVGVVVEVVA